MEKKNLEFSVGKKTPQFFLSTKKQNKFMSYCFSMQASKIEAGTTQARQQEERTAKTAQCEMHCYFIHRTPVTFSATYMGNS